MSITNIIDDKGLTIFQGVNGICLFEESWIKERNSSKDELQNAIDEFAK